MPPCQSRTVPPVSNARTLIASIAPLSAGAPHTRRRHDKVAGDQFEPLVVTGEAGVTKRIKRRAGCALVPEPVAKLTARRPGGSSRSCLEIIGLHIVDREAQQQWRRVTRSRAGRRLPTN